MMKNIIITVLFIVGCTKETTIEKCSKHHQQHNDYKSFSQGIGATAISVGYFL